MLDQYCLHSGSSNNDGGGDGDTCMKIWRNILYIFFCCFCFSYQKRFAAFHNKAWQAGSGLRILLTCSFIQETQLRLVQEIMESGIKSLTNIVQMFVLPIRVFSMCLLFDFLFSSSYNKWLTKGATWQLQVYVFHLTQANKSRGNLRVMMFNQLFYVSFACCTAQWLFGCELCILEQSTMRHRSVCMQAYKCKLSRLTWV